MNESTANLDFWLLLLIALAILWHLDSKIDKLRNRVDEVETRLRDSVDRRIDAVNERVDRR